ncbi:RidA family protein [Hydrogenivirga sp.]
MRKSVYTDRAPRPVGPYSQAVEVNGTLYLSGQVGIDPSTGELKEGFLPQAEQVLKNIEAVLEEAGYKKEDVVKVVIYLTDIGRFKEFNELYEDFFSKVEPKPARVTVGVKELPLGADIEIEVTAVKG